MARAHPRSLGSRGVRVWLGRGVACEEITRMTYELYHGDCLDVLPTVGAQSVDATLDREINTAPFNKHMALVTEAYDIIKRVGVVRVLEPPHGLDMVNIGVAGCVSLAAATARVVIAHAGGALNTAPIRAVVARMPTTPKAICRATIPTIGTGGRTETKPPRTLQGSGQCHRLFAGFAGKSNLRSRRRSWSKALLPHLKVTRLRAYGNIARPNLCRLAGECNAAHLASERGITNQTSTA